MRNNTCTYNDITITSWCCYKHGSRFVGIYGHIEWNVWFLSHGRYNPEYISGIRDSISTVEDTAREIDFSDSDEDDDATIDHDEEEWQFVNL